MAKESPALCNNDDRLPPIPGRENTYAGVTSEERGVCPLWAPGSTKKDNNNVPVAERTVMTASKCWSGSNRPIAMPGHFGVEIAQKENELPKDPVFLACNLRLPTTKLRSAINWGYQGCWGGPNNTCACVDDDRDTSLNGLFAYTDSGPLINSSKCNTGFLCGAKCPDGYYRSFTESCKPCNDPGYSRSLLKGLFWGMFFMFIPLLFNGLYFSVSDKTAAQYLVYPRMLVDLCVVLYLVYKSLFRYWPRELLHWERTDGHSKTEAFNNLFMECGFGWDFETRYYVYLFMPFVLVIGVGLQVCFVWFVYTFDNSRRVIDGGETDDQLTWKRMLIKLPSSESKEAATAMARAEKGDATVVHKEDYQEWIDNAQAQAKEDEKTAPPNDETMTSQGSCLNGIARSLGNCLPDSSTPRGSRIAFAPPRDNDGWERFKNHATQVMLLLLCMLYITMVNYSLVVFDCSGANDRWQLGGPQLGSSRADNLIPAVDTAPDLVGWNLGFATGPDDRAQPGSGIWGSAHGFVEEEPTIACDWKDATWRKLAIVGSCAFCGYTLAIPGSLLYVFLTNEEAARRGDMRYMQRYGFLLKPYKQDVYYWEIMNMFRKGLLSCIVRLTTESPFMCGAYALAVLTFIVSHQARWRPYKYDKHNNCAIAVLSVGVLNFFSSLIFITKVATLLQNQILLVVNLVLVVYMFCWAFFGFIKDLLMFARMLAFTVKCEGVGRAEEEREDFWLKVDKPGLIRLQWYDPLVVRNRYSHVVYREERLAPSDPVAAPTGEDETEKRGRTWVEGKPLVTKCVQDDQNSAHANWVNFHENFAKFVAEISKERVAEQYLKDLQDRDRDQLRKSQRVLGGVEVDDEEAFASPVVNRDDAGMGTRGDGNAEVREGFCHLESSVLLLEQLYSEKNLSYMVLYMEYAIKNGLTEKFKLDQLGPSDLASHILQFTRIFAEELVGADNGGASVMEGGVDAFSNLTGGQQVEAGGWNDQEDMMRQSSMVARATESDESRSRDNTPEGGEEERGSRESSTERRSMAIRTEGLEDAQGGETKRE